MLHKIPEFDLYYVAYLKDDPAKEPIAASGKPSRRHSGSSAQAED
jgi:hypothetical protein